MLPDCYAGDGRLMEGFAAEAGLSLSPLDALIRETSAWLTEGLEKHETP